MLKVIYLYGSTFVAVRTISQLTPPISAHCTYCAIGTDDQAIVIRHADLLSRYKSAKEKQAIQQNYPRTGNNIHE
jgi:hypothetical protein